MPIPLKSFPKPTTRPYPVRQPTVFAPKAAKSILAFGLPKVQVEVWCISDQLEDLPEGENPRLLDHQEIRKGLVFTWPMIMDQVWPSGTDWGGSSNLVDAYVNFLRKKVDQGHPVKLIQTVRGAGYTIQELAC